MVNLIYDLYKGIWIFTYLIAHNWRCHNCNNMNANEIISQLN